LTGVLTPTTGEYQVNGKVASLLELGAGFNPELSGLENVYFNGSIIGYSKEAMDQKLQSILDFADIGEFIHQPVKTYSSGMYVRLAFAIAINVDPEVLIVDEALSVGDMRFQLKCFRKLEEIKNNGTTILFVTHDTGAVINHCDRAIWLHDGEVKELGKPESVCKHYMSFMAYGSETEVKASVGAKELSPSLEKKEETTDIPWKSVAGCESFGEGGAEITHVAFYDAETRRSLEVLEGGEEVCLGVKIKVEIEITEPIVGFYFSDHQGNNIFGTNTFIKEKEMVIFQKDSEKIVQFKFQFPQIHNEEYSLTVAIAEGTQVSHIQRHWVHDALTIRVFQNSLEGIHGSRLILEKITIDCE